MTTAIEPSARRRRAIRPFTPSKEAPSSLSERTVGRDELLSLLLDRIRTAARSKNRPHTLLVGPRGAGKTHLVEVALYRATHEIDVAERLAVVRIDEDAVGITRYSDILREVVRGLGGSRTEASHTASTTLEADIEHMLGGGVLLLVIENLDRLFGALGKSGQRDLRAWIETSGQVMVLATSPLLFPAIGQRSEPWYGGLAISHLPDLGVEQGRELLALLAAQAGDAELADFIASPTGQARLRAIHALAGGSPRIWSILSECLTVDTLDELVPAVEALLEALVPYYQQLLWDLSGNEQRLVRALASEHSAADTVAELAEDTGIDRNVASTTLGRLAELKWVRAEKRPGLDQRTTWYRLREPMLRHHLQYRGSAHGQPLVLIVELLRAWFQPEERRADLGSAVPGSESERLLVATLSDEPGLLHAAYRSRDVDALLVEARRWLVGQDAHGRTWEAGALIEVAVKAARHGAAAGTEIVAARELSGSVAETANELLALTRGGDRHVTESERVGELVRAAALGTSGRTHAVLELVSAAWDGSRDLRRARDRLTAVSSTVGEGGSDPLSLDIAHELAYWTGEAGDAGAACDLAVRLLADVGGLTHVGKFLADNIRWVLRRNAVRLLTAPIPDDAATEVSGSGLATTFQSAVAGSAEALARLPAELAEIAAEHRRSREAGWRPLADTRT